MCRVALLVDRSCKADSRKNVLFKGFHIKSVRAFRTYLFADTLACVRASRRIHGKFASVPRRNTEHIGAVVPYLPLRRYVGIIFLYLMKRLRCKRRRLLLVRCAVTHYFARVEYAANTTSKKKILRLTDTATSRDKHVSVTTYQPHDDSVRKFYLVLRIRTSEYIRHNVRVRTEKTYYKRGTILVYIIVVKGFCAFDVYPFMQNFAKSFSVSKVTARHITPPCSALRSFLSPFSVFQKIHSPYS